ncbi:MAG: class I SAM-dependent methyltransferase [Lacibacter sp.]
MKERKEQNFDVFAETYREAHTQNIKFISGTNSYYFAEYKVKELRQFEENKKLSVLDLGCGDGVTEIFFEKYFSQFKIQGIDVSLKSIEEAQKRPISNTSFQIYNGHMIPYENESFDIVFVAGVLHHIDTADHQKVVNEIFRVLKPGGRLYLFEHNPLNPLTRYLVNTCEFDEGVTLLYSRESKRLLSNSGFRIKNLIYTIFFPRKRFFNLMIPMEKYLRSIPFGGQYYFRAVKD